MSEVREKLRSEPTASMTFRRAAEELARYEEELIRINRTIERLREQRDAAKAAIMASLPPEDNYHKVFDAGDGFVVVASKHAGDVAVTLQEIEKT